MAKETIGSKGSPSKCLDAVCKILCHLRSSFLYPLFLFIYNRLQVLPWRWETWFMVCLYADMEKLRTWATDCSLLGSELF